MTTREAYLEAIAKLDAYAAVELDPVKEGAARQKIMALRRELIEASLDEFVRRTPLLTSLVASLQAVISGASSTPMVGQAIGEVKGLLDTVSSLLKAPIPP